MLRMKELFQDWQDEQDAQAALADQIDRLVEDMAARHDNPITLDEIDRWEWRQEAQGEADIEEAS